MWLGNEGGMVPFLSFPSLSYLSLPPFPLEIGPLIQLAGLGKHCKHPSSPGEVWGGASFEIELVAFWL